MTLPLLITLGVLIGGWSFLAVLGNERQRQVQNREIERRNAETAAASTAAAAAKAAEPTVVR
jgi:predicted amino acid dehydrogenase